MTNPITPLIDTVLKNASTWLAKIEKGMGRTPGDREPPSMTQGMMRPVLQLIPMSEIVVRSVLTWLLKIELKRKMEKGLGRTVQDGELTSITAWMKVPAKDMPYPRDKNPHI